MIFALQVDLVTEKEALRIEYETMKTTFSEENLSLKNQVNQLNEQMKNNQINAEGNLFLSGNLDFHISNPQFNKLSDKRSPKC